MPAKSINARQLALRICHSVLTQGQSLSSQLDRQLAQLDDPRDQGLCSELCYGFCRYYFVLSAALTPLLKKPLKSKDIDIQIILLLGLYQIRFMRVDDHAAVNETVNLVLRQKKSWAKGLVNAVLRNYLRQLSSSPTERQQLTAREQQIAYPQWMRDKLIKDWGSDAITVFEAANQAPPMMLRVDLTQTTREQYLQILANNKIDASAHVLIPTAIILQQARAVDQIPGFDDARVSVQDAAAQLAAPLLNCEPGMRVLDACAAPGGKTLHMLQAAPNLDLIALDQDANRLQRVTQNLQRAGQQAKLICADAAQTDSWFDGVPFDRILLDAPCSASGIIRRHPDIRLLRKVEDVGQLVKLQKRLLDAMWKLLKPGGQMLYSTCSIFRAENELQIAAFIERQADCIESPINSVQWGLSRPYGRQILPGFNDMDGFFYALLEKRD